MSPSGADLKIRELARQLGLETRGDCAKRLREHAVARVCGWIEAMGIKTEGTLLQITASMLSLKILFIETDDDIRRYAEEYRKDWPELGAQLRSEFLRADTMGLLLAHPAPEPGAHSRFAFIDARGDRSARAYFTAWHEIAHLLVHPPQLSFSGFRRVSTGSEAKDSVEALVDQIAGELAFYAPFVEPALAAELEQEGHLTLDGIARIGGAVAPEASFSATAHALVRMINVPAVFLVADMRLKPTEVRRLAGDQLTLIPGPAPREKLRVVSAFPNDTARTAGFHIFQNMRVPAASVVAEVYANAEVGTAVGEEDQADWESGGRHLPPLGLHVEARKFGSVAYALVQCTPALPNHAATARLRV